MGVQTEVVLNPHRVPMDIPDNQVRAQHLRHGVEPDRDPAGGRGAHPDVQKPAVRLPTENETADGVYLRIAGAVMLIVLSIAAGNHNDRNGDGQDAPERRRMSETLQVQEPVDVEPEVERVAGAPSIIRRAPVSSELPTTNWK